MLFNSFEFIFFFLPVTMASLFIISRTKHRYSAAFLFIASIAFYAGWSVYYTPLLILSIVFNFLVGKYIFRKASSGDGGAANRALLFGVIVNIAAIVYYKYIDFFIEAVSQVTGIHIDLLNTELPLGISFFTFTQIAFLVDAAKGKTADANFFRYGLFVTYFPHLIAGPILHHREMISQFEKPKSFGFNAINFSSGLTLFTIGMFKKIVIADNIAPAADAIFSSASRINLTFMEAWTGALSYTLQLYYDFSGYSDMALGLSLMMGVRMPLNFNSPYKAHNIIEFWRRWHITLSRFLRDYLYIPLGGNRRGRWRRHANLLTTMLIGGLWHGAGWTFVLWGGLHGIYLTINHAWHAAPPHFRRLIPRPLGWLLTFLAVVVAWVFFRASSIPEAMQMLSAMTGGNGWALPSPLAYVLAPVFGPSVTSGGTFGNGIIDATDILPKIVAALTVALALPNSQQILARYRPALTSAPLKKHQITWRPTVIRGAVVGAALAMSLVLMTGESPFLYFRF